MGSEQGRNTPEKQDATKFLLNISATGLAVLSGVVLSLCGFIVSLVLSQYENNRRSTDVALSKYGDEITELQSDQRSLRDGTVRGLAEIERRVAKHEEDIRTLFDKVLTHQSNPNAHDSRYLQGRGRP